MIKSSSSTLPVASEKHLSNYASAALAGIGVLSAAQVADAQIVTTTSAGQTIVDNGTIDLFVGAGFDINGPALHLSRSSFRTSFGYYHLEQKATEEYMKVLISNGAPALAENLPKGAPIDANAGSFRGPASTFIGFSAIADSRQSAGNFAGKTGYLAFSFTDPNQPTQTDYGWAEITLNDHQNVLTLDNAAYDESGAPITAGEVPEPGSLALLAGGAGCLVAWRLRRRRSKATLVGDPGSGLAS